MIEFTKYKNILVLTYYPEDYDNRFSPEGGWVDQRFSGNQTIILKRTFELSQSQLIPENDIIESEEFEEEGYHFIIGNLTESHYKLFDSVFNIKNQFYIHRSIELNESFFVALRNTSIIGKIDEQCDEDVYIGPSETDNLPATTYERLIKEFPNTYETKLYIQARVSSIISDYLSTRKNKEAQYNKYLNKKVTVKEGTILKSFKDYEAFKLGTIKDKLEKMLLNEINYTEHQWQNEILEIILLLFPKYLAVFKEVKFKDIYSNKNRYLDFALVDSLGYIDIIEIKKPFNKPIVSKTKYRDNHVPNRELSGTIMQIEKYIYYLSKTGQKGESSLNQKYLSDLPEGLTLKITNPKGIIIMGRNSILTKEQEHDFEIIKRKYKNLIDIFTYDDLIKRLNISIEQVKKL